MSCRQLLRQCHSVTFCFLLLVMLAPLSKSDDDLQLLLNFKSSLNYSNTDVFTSWTQHNSVCNFTGIVCNSNGFVTEINLPDRRLEGVLPFHSICKLQYLHKISLGFNSLSGVISDDLKNCRKLQVLDLDGNFFSGQVPDLSGLYELRHLRLNGSGFSGFFPWKSLENLTNLEFLSIGDNLFDPTSSFPAEILKLDKLYWVYLSNCSIRGQIPEGISNLSLLENLELSNNQLFGQIPEGIGKLGKLRQLEIYNNSLSGKLPVGFGNLTSLVNLDASTNMLEGEIGELETLEGLASLQLFENQFSGEIPEEFGKFEYLSGLSLYRNKFTGLLPERLGSKSDFIYIDVSENFLTGLVPPDMCKNGKMTDLLILQNKFTGRIPESYANCKSLIRLRINNNSLSGFVPPGLWGLPELTIIDLSTNRFEGPLAPEIGNAKSLGSLILAENQFSGELPTAISSATSLVSIQLTSNQFSGKIPENIGGLKKLNRLYLNNNLFYGTIPDSVGSCVSLDDINLSNNSFSGKIPANLGSLPTLNSIDLSSNKLSGQIPVSLSSVRLSNLDLSNNQLIGPIPSSLSLEVFRKGFDGNPGLCSDSLSDIRPCSSSARNSNHLGLLLSCLAAGLLVLVISACYIIFVRTRPNNLENPLKRCSWDMKSFRVLSFNERDIIDSVKSENLIGKGGSGNVYKVVLGNGNELAVKHIWTPNLTDPKTCRSSSPILTKRKRFGSSEFDAEVATLSAVRHMNVVKLYCSVTSEDSKLLVYEYLPNGSLWDRLHSCKKIHMGWELRYAIAVGAARGLEYLHHGFDRPVIHRDVKSSNILLDEEWKPRIADFGLAKIVQADGGEWTFTIAGTYGYMAPEYGYTWKVNEKSDVYSFGVVLMELVTGKRPTEPEFGENKDIVNWVTSKIISKEKALEIVDSRILENLKEEAIKVLRIAVHCTAKIPALRPSMRIVVKMLEEAEPHQLSDIVVVKKEGGSCPE